MNALHQKVAWIIGGSGGIGSATAYSLAARGVSVAIGYFSQRERAEEVAKKCITDYKVEAQAIHTPVHTRASVQSAYKRVVEKLGYPSIIIHAAGSTKAALFQDTTEQDLDEMVNTHVKGAAYVIQAGLPSLLQNKSGSILLVTSIWGEVGGAFEVAYSTVKGAQISFVKALAKELAPSGIRVNAVSPGAIDTGMLREQLDEGDKEFLLSRIPMARLGKPEEVAALIQFLTSQKASYITGQVLRVSGGWDG